MEKSCLIKRNKIGEYAVVWGHFSRVAKIEKETKNIIKEIEAHS